MKHNDATRVWQAVDRRVDAKLGTQTETTWGTVDSVSSDGKTCAVLLYGEPTTASDGFRIPGDLAVSVGDSVKVAMNDRNERWVCDVAIASAYKKVSVNPNTGEILTGDGTVPPATFGGVPTGVILPYAAASAPTGYLLCDGTPVSRTTYATLFGLIGTTYGAGDGSTTFNLPDLRQRFPLGKAASGTGSTLGTTGGSIDHTHTESAHTHTSAFHGHNITNTHTHTGPSHTHTSAAHSHPLSSNGWALIMVSAGSNTFNVYYQQKTGLSAWTPISSPTGSYSTSQAPNQTVGTPLRGNTDSTTPGDTGADGTGVTGSGSDSSTDGTTPGATGSTTPTGTGANNAPFLVVNYIIKT